MTGGARWGIMEVNPDGSFGKSHVAPAWMHPDSQRTFRAWIFLKKCITKPLYWFIDFMWLRDWRYITQPERR